MTATRPEGRDHREPDDPAQEKDRGANQEAANDEREERAHARIDTTPGSGWWPGCEPAAVSARRASPDTLGHVQADRAEVAASAATTLGRVARCRLDGEHMRPNRRQRPARSFGFCMREGRASNTTARSPLGDRAVASSAVRWSGHDQAHGRITCEDGPRAGQPRHGRGVRRNGSGTGCRRP